jgi:hypothetical protein
LRHSTAFRRLTSARATRLVRNADSAYILALSSSKLQKPIGPSPLLLDKRASVNITTFDGIACDVEDE